MKPAKMTKIIATLGPASESPEMIKKMILGGVNVFRFNTKHNSYEWHLNLIKKVHQIAEDLSIPVGILLDLQGAEIIIDTADKKTIKIKKNDEIILVDSDKNYKGAKVLIVPQVVLTNLELGDKFSVDDGYFGFVVTKKLKNVVTAVSIDSGEIRDRRSFNFIKKEVQMPTLTARDIKNLGIVAEANVNFIALSFVKSKNDIDVLREEINKLALKCKIIAKIETQRAVDAIEEILLSCDGVMVARGDLGVEVPIEHITYLQKEIIKKCRESNKPVIVATQMLQSMVESSKPTRAEVADVANAVFDETDCVMLSEETATGKYPIEAINVMCDILEFNESKKQSKMLVSKIHNSTNLIAKAAMSVLENDRQVKVDKILIFTETGLTANVLASYRPDVPVIALSNSKNTVAQLALTFGVIPFFVQMSEGIYEYPKKIIETLLETKILKKNSHILVIHGRRWNEPGGTNALAVVNV